MSETKIPMTALLRSIDDEGIKNLMRYFQMDDYDVMLRYMTGIGVKRKAAKTSWKQSYFTACYKE
jgi:hypothetical protein